MLFFYLKLNQSSPCHQLVMFNFFLCSSNLLYSFFVCPHSYWLSLVRLIDRVKFTIPLHKSSKSPKNKSFNCFHFSPNKFSSNFMVLVICKYYPHPHPFSIIIPHPVPHITHSSIDLSEAAWD